jgi:hypothetical protein
MAGAVDQLLYLNKCPLSWNSTRSIVAGLYPMVGFTEINCEESREGEYVQAQAPDGVPLGITTGVYQVGSFSFKMLAASAQFLYETLMLSFDPNSGAALGSIGDARWSYQILMTEPGSGPTMSMTVAGIKIEKRKPSFQKGTGALEWDHECKAMTVTTRGVGGGLTGLVARLFSLQRALS